MIRPGRHIKEGFVGFFRHPANSIATVFTMFISLLLVSFFLIVVSNLDHLTQEVEGSLSLSALVSRDASDNDIRLIQDNIKKIEGVVEAEYRTSEQEFDYYIEQNKDLKDFYETYRDDNPFHPTFIITVETGEMFDAVKNKVSAIKGIDSVHDGGDNTYKLIGILEKIRLFGLALVGALILLAIYLIYNTIKLSIESRKSEIGIMRIVGATKGFIRAPFLVEGIIIGVIGAFFALLLTIVAYLYLYSSSNGALFGVFSLIEPTLINIVKVSLVVLGIGILTGLIGSFFSVNKSLRSVR